MYFLLQVFIGRPILWALAHDGETGVISILRLLKKELDLAMALSGMVKLKVRSFFCFLPFKAPPFYGQ